MEIVEIDVTKNGDYVNLNLKPKLAQGIKGIPDGQAIVVEKKYAEGKKIDCAKNGKTWVSYLCQVLYKGEEPSFFLTEKEHELYKDCGGIGDKVKIGLKKEMKVIRNQEVIIPVLSFEKVE